MSSITVKRAVRNTKKSMKMENNLNGCKAFYKRRSLEVYAPTSYNAQVKAAQLFKAKKNYDIAVVLCEVKGETITHKADF